MTERYVEKQLATNLVSRQYAGVVVGTWEKNVAEGTESLRLRFRTWAHTIATDADTTTGEAEVSAPAELPDLHADTTDLTTTFADAGTDPSTGADLTQISKAGVLELMKALYRAELSNAANS